MSSNLENKDACEDIPVRNLQHIQSFGALLAIEKGSNQITHVSANIEQALGILPEALLGKPLNSFENNPKISALKEILGSSSRKRALGENLSKVNEYEILFHEQEKHFIFEWVFFQKNGSTLIDIFSEISDLFKTTENIKTIKELAQALCEKIKKIFSIDKVLLYHFLKDGSGIVLGEAKEEKMEPYMGLRFPKSDVPEQVRKLFLENPLRLIQDSKSSPVPIKSITTPPELDLSYCLTKGVSPVHQEYTQNMGIATSYSYGIKYEGVLWGLLCFHHLTPKQVPYDERLALSFFAEILQKTVVRLAKEKDLEFEKKQKEIFTKIVEAAANTNEEFTKIFEQYQQDLLSLLNARGLCLYYEGKFHVFGSAPNEEQLKNLISWLKNNTKKEESYYATNSLEKHYPESASFSAVGSGLLALKIGTQKEDFILWFRPELIVSVEWAGNPNDKSVGDSASLRPRGSFSIWKEEVKGKANEWQSQEIAAALKLQQQIQGAVLNILYAKEKISEAEKFQISLATDKANEGIFILGPDKKIVWHNQWFKNLFPKSDAIEGLDFFELLKQQNADLSFLEKNNLEMNREWIQEVVFKNNGDTRFFEIRINSYKIDLVGQERFIGIALDITELKKISNDLALLNKEKDAFIRMASHDLRNPLSIILASASGLENEKQISKEGGDLVKTVIKQGQFILNILNELMNVVVIQSGQFSIRKERTNFQQFFEELAKFNHLVAAKKEISLKTEFHFEMQEGEIDQGKVKQVTDNLLSNAIKYSNPKTEVVFRASTKDMTLFVEVEDHGQGIPEKEHNQVFQQFVKLSPKPTANETSHGLGLAICKQLVQAQEGKIGFKSEQGKGSTFYFSVPLGSVSQSKESAAPLSKILIVDDDADIVNFLKAALSKIPGAVIETALSGEEALKKAPLFKPDLILMDVNMPVLDGPATLKKLRENSELSKIAVIFATGSSDPAAQEALRKEGAIGVVTKPFDMAALPEQIKTMWNAK